MQRYLFILFLFFALSGNAQGVLNNLGSGKSAGLNGINSSFTDIYALSGNQAGIGWMDSFGAFAFAEQRFLLQELTGVNAGAVLPTKAGNFGASIGYFGFENFSEQKVGLAYGRKLFKKFTLGGQLDFFNVQTNDFGGSSTFTFELGMQLQLNKKLLLSSHTLNPIRAKLGNEDALTSNFRIGAHYKIIETADLFVEVENDLEFDAVFRSGITYRPIQPLEFRAAIRTNPINFAFGVSYQLKNGFGIDLAVVQHQVLGFTPSAGFVWQKNQK